MGNDMSVHVVAATNKKPWLIGGSSLATCNNASFNHGSYFNTPEVSPMFGNSNLG